MLSRVTSKTCRCICSFLFAHTCVLSVMMLSEPCTCCSGGAHQQHKQRVINIYHSIFVKLDTQLSRQVKAVELHPFEGQTWAVKRDTIWAGKGGLENSKQLFFNHCCACTFDVQRVNGVSEELYNEKKCKDTPLVKNLMFTGVRSLNRTIVECLRSSVCCIWKNRWKQNLVLKGQW